MVFGPDDSAKTDDDLRSRRRAGVLVLLFGLALMGFVWAFPATPGYARSQHRAFALFFCGVFGALAGVHAIASATWFLWKRRR